MSVNEESVEAAHLEGAARETLKGYGFTAEETDKVFTLGDFADRLRDEATRTNMPGIRVALERPGTLTITRIPQGGESHPSAWGSQRMVEWLVNDPVGVKSFYEEKGKEGVLGQIQREFEYTYVNAGHYIDKSSPLHAEARELGVVGEV